MSLTVSLELAKKMKELWWEKETHFAYQPRTQWVDVWPNTWCQERFFIEGSLATLRDRIYHSPHWEVCTFYAPTAQEILDELPRYLMREEFSMRYILLVTPSDELREAYYRDMHKLTNYDDKVVFVENSVAEALWQLRCWCKENWYLK